MWQLTYINPHAAIKPELCQGHCPKHSGTDFDKIDSNENRDHIR